MTSATRRRARRYTPYASTYPWDCLADPSSRCASDPHDHTPMVGDPCADPGCDEILRWGDRAYFVAELPATVGPPPQLPFGPVRARHRPVCWRHISPTDPGHVPST